jgi:hypothetical protein
MVTALVLAFIDSFLPSTSHWHAYLAVIAFTFLPVSYWIMPGYAGAPL